MENNMPFFHYKMGNISYTQLFVKLLVKLKRFEYILMSLMLFGILFVFSMLIYNTWGEGFAKSTALIFAGAALFLVTYEVRGLFRINNMLVQLDEEHVMYSSIKERLFKEERKVLIFLLFAISNMLQFILINNYEQRFIGMAQMVPVLATQKAPAKQVASTSKEPKREIASPALVAEKGELADKEKLSFGEHENIDFTKKFISDWWKTAVAEMDRTGIPASIIIAQGILESRSGQSILAVKNKNFFGIKCFSKNCPKGHCSNHTDDHHKDFFLIYGSAKESFKHHSEFLLKYRYRELLKLGKTRYAEWAHGLQRLGYATDQAYGQKLILIIQKHNLTKYDTL